ncbi:hypothetical protein R1sor_007861 [Riccia sorocarpa]|uniref:Ubiquitin-like protease family profile domain-containing protein n=1 Tax=Riccia sorocarpa TaxID=122646 RepID=A0ABD3HVB3_9MARC
MDRSARLKKRSGAKKDQLEETDPEHWKHIATSVAEDARTPKRTPEVKKRKGKLVQTPPSAQKPGKKVKFEGKKKRGTPTKPLPKKRKLTMAGGSTGEEAESMIELPPVTATLEIEKVPGWTAIAIPYDYKELRGAFLDYDDAKWSAGKLNIRDKCNDRYLCENWEQWRRIAAPDINRAETRKSFLHYAGLERNGIPIEWETVNLNTQMNKLEESDLLAAEWYLFQRKFTFKGEIVVQDDPLADLSHRRHHQLRSVFPENQRTKRPFLPEIDTAIYGALSTRIEDRKAKFRAKEADEAGPSSEPPKQSSVETSGIKKSVEGARVLRSGETRRGQRRLQQPYSQQVDLASSSQPEREKLERLEKRCKEAEATLETLREDHTVLCAKKHIRAHPGNIDAYIANPDLVPELTVIKSSFETKGDGTWMETCPHCKNRIGFLPTIQPGSCSCRYHLHCFGSYMSKSKWCDKCLTPFLPVMYNFLSTPFNRHEKEILSEYTEGVAKRYEAKVEKATPDIASVEEKNEELSTPVKATPSGAKKALFEETSGDDSLEMGSHDGISPNTMVENMTGIITPPLVSPTIPPLLPRSMFPPSLEPDSQAEVNSILDAELEPLVLPSSASNNNSVPQTNSQFANNFFGKMYPTFKVEKTEVIVGEAGKDASPKAEVVKSAPKKIIELSPDKQGEKKKVVKIPRIAMDSLKPARWISSEVINCYINEIIIPSIHEMPGCFFAHTHWYTLLEETLIDESPEATNWDDNVHNKLTKHTKGLLPTLQSEADMRYLVVPIHGNDHWSVVVIRFNETHDSCVIHHMDSIHERHDTKQIGTFLSKWIIYGLQVDMPIKIESTGITQQTNGYDYGYGVHVLYVITKLMEADKEGNLLEYFENGGLPDSWGTTKIVADFRLKVHELFTNLLESDTQ